MKENTVLRFDWINGLWYARFVKPRLTRNDRRCKVHYNGQRSSRANRRAECHAHSAPEMTNGTWIVKAIDPERRPASEAVLLYEEICGKCRETRKWRWHVN